MFPYMKVATHLLLFGCGSVLCGYFVKVALKRLLLVDDDDDQMYKTTFLSEYGVRGRENSNKDTLNMLTPIVEFINDAKESLDLCFYLITGYPVVNAVLEAKKRGVKVRIITDYNAGIVSNKYAKDFYKEGIEVYTKETDPEQVIMHSKFCIKDGSTVLMASMNLTQNTSKGSYDNMLISSDEDLVEPFKQQFEDLLVEIKSDWSSNSNSQLKNKFT